MYLLVVHLQPLRVNLALAHTTPGQSEYSKYLHTSLCVCRRNTNLERIRAATNRDADRHSARNATRNRQPRLVPAILGAGAGAGRQCGSTRRMMVEVEVEVDRSAVANPKMGLESAVKS